MEQKDKNFLDNYLDKKVGERIATYQTAYATNPDGSVNDPLAQRIDWEVTRRGEMGKQLDIYEPLRWIGIKTVLGTGGAIAAKHISDKLTHNDKGISGAVMAGVAITTAISNGLDAVRVYPRYMAGLEGGLDTAIKMVDRDTYGVACDVPTHRVCDAALEGRMLHLGVPSQTRI